MAGHRTFRILTSSQQSGIQSMQSNKQKRHLKKKRHLKYKKHIKIFLYFTFYTELFASVILIWFHLTNVMPLQTARLFSNCCLCQWFSVSSDSQSHKTVIRFLRTWSYLKFEVPTLLSMNIINSSLLGVKMVAAIFHTMLANVKILVLCVQTWFATANTQPRV